MKLLRFFSFFLVFLVLACYSLGIFVKQVTYEFTLDIQAPISKAYQALASHEFKSILYPNINPTTAKVEDFKEGNTTYIEYEERGTQKFVRETIRKVDSLQLVILDIESLNATSTMEQHFTDRKLITRFHVKEIIRGKSVLERAMLFLFQKAIQKNKKQRYDNLKTTIESTPDFNFRVSEQK